MNIWGWLIVLGAVGASVGFTVYGMGTSTLQPDMLMVDAGKYLMVGGLMLIVGEAYRRGGRFASGWACRRSSSG